MWGRAAPQASPEVELLLLLWLCPVPPVSASASWRHKIKMVLPFNSDGGEVVVSFCDSVWCINTGHILYWV